MKRGEENTRNPTIKRLYEAFAPYSATPQTMVGCSCCVSEADIAALFSAPLSQIPAKKVSLYSRKATTTWGNEREWKHFLPRLCELSLQEELDFDWIGNKFSLVEWRAWPGEEVDVLHDFFNELMVSLAQNGNWFEADVWLQDLARLGENGDGGLQKWLQNAASEEIVALDRWAGKWQNADSLLDRWMRRPEIESDLLRRL